MRTLAWYLHFAFSLMLTIPQMRRHEKNKASSEDSLTLWRQAYSVASAWALKQVNLSGGKFIVSGAENIPAHRPVLFVSNHQSNFDTAIFLCHIPTAKGFIAKVELLKIPVLRTWMEYIGCVFIDRSDIKKSAQAILDGIKILKSGHSMVVFPEGTRSKGDAMGEFKAGSFKLATKSGVAIVPVTINGSYKLMEANGNRIKPAEVKIQIHPAIETAGMPKDEQQELPSRVYDIIRGSLPSS